ncbi:MAG: hypothetical protein EP326_07585 [Deltaproteobacteria bacterium]|nr:MAG: hypothetical protein EP326_07585 [Deltaproteobacteria bacterium]TNF28734.1 MAG: hypothetical protein EP319_08260 [Deltaproteobacteria bacterium]
MCSDTNRAFQESPKKDSKPIKFNWNGLGSLVKGSNLSVCLSVPTSEVKNLIRKARIKRSEASSQYVNLKFDNLVHKFPHFHRNFLIRIESVFSSLFKLDVNFNFKGHYVVLSQDMFLDQTIDHVEIFLEFQNFTLEEADVSIVGSQIENFLQGFNEFDVKILNAFHYTPRFFFRNISEVHHLESDERHFALLSAFLHYKDRMIDDTDFGIGKSKLWQELNSENKNLANETIFKITKYFNVLESIFLIYHFGKSKDSDIDIIADKIEDELDFEKRFQSISSTFDKMSVFFEQRSDKDTTEHAEGERHRDIWMSVFAGIAGVTGFILGLEKDSLMLDPNHTGSALSVLSEKILSNDFVWLPFIGVGVGVLFYMFVRNMKRDKLTKATAPSRSKLSSKSGSNSNSN